MRLRTLFAGLALATGLFVAIAAAQHDHEGQTAAPADKKMMMMGHAQTAKLVDQLVKSLEAIQTETDPVALKAKLAEHGALLKELQAKVGAQSHMMEMMQHKN